MQVDEKAAGVLLAPNHALTLAHCLSNYTRWFGGFYSFSINVFGEEVEVARVDVQSIEENPLPFALLTLKSNLTSVFSPVCIGPYRQDLLPAAFGFAEAGKVRVQPVRIYRSGQCASFHSYGYVADTMLCGSAGVELCGGPLVQFADGSWMLIALSSGESPPLARYVGLASARWWLSKLK